MKAPMIFLEWRTFLTRTPGLIALALVIALAGYALSAGQRERLAVVSAQSAFAAGVNQDAEEWRGELAKIETEGRAESPYLGQAMNIRLPATLPPGPLADFAAGPADLHPSSSLISPWSNSANLFSNYQFANPTLLALGSFDLTFVVVVLMPLLMIAVSFDALAAERSQGSLRLIAAQPARLGGLIWTRLVLRNGFLWIALIGFALGAALLHRGEAPMADRVARFAAWTAVASLYGLFWFGLVALAVAFLKRAETAAATLVALWGILVLAVPALAGAAGEALYPPPSRLAYLSEMRAAQGEANREVDRLTKGFLLDHPDLTVSDEEVPGYYRSAYLSNLEVEKRTAAILDGFAQSRAKRRALMSAVQYISPAIIAQETLNIIAGADIDRYLRFQDEARRSLLSLSDLIGPAVVARQRITLAEFDGFERYAFQERSVSSAMAQAALPLLFIALISGFLIALARQRFRAPLEKLL